MNFEVLLFPVLLLLIRSANGFLLDGPTNGGKQTTANSQFLTETEFLQAKNLLKQNTDDLRHDMDKTFALMTSQLKSKFDLLETKLAEADKRNETNDGCVSIEKYLALEQKLTNVQRENDQIKQKQLILENEVLSLKNNSSKQDTKIEELQKLGAIKSLHEINALQQSVHLNTDKIHSLSVTEQARSQDFVALYNITTSTRKKVTEMKTSTNSLVLQLKNNHTMEMKAMKQILDSELRGFQTSYNSTINYLQTKEISMQKQITENNERVAVFALASSKSGSVIQFNAVQLSVGIKNISAFKSTGKFICENEGVYLIAVTVSAKDSHANFCVRRDNTSPVACARIGQPSGDAYHSGTSVIAQPLHVNDTIYVDTDYSIESGFLTYLTIMKLR